MTVRTKPATGEMAHRAKWPATRADNLNSSSISHTHMVEGEMLNKRKGQAWGTEGQQTRFGHTVWVFSTFKRI